ncbi:hypothetical protein V8D89_007925 [Ganoderma adspersum]
MSPITLSNGESVRIFHTFIFSNELARAPYIYGLKLPGPYDFRGRFGDHSLFQIMDDHLVALLRAAVCIQYLYFPTSTSDSIFASVAELTTLRELHAICNSFQRNFPFNLTAFRSPIRSLFIKEINPIVGNISGGVLHRELSHFAPTLEALALELLHYFELNIMPSSITTQFTAVRSLKFNDFIFGFDSLAVLLRLFPNLDNTLDLGRFAANPGEEDYPALRERSKEAQRAHAWPCLDRLACDAVMAFVLALQCPVRRMDIEMTHLLPYYDIDAKRYLVDALHHNCPTHLHLSLSFRYGLSVLDGLLPFEAAHRLTHLVIIADFNTGRIKWGARPKRKEIPWNRFFGRVINSVKHLRLTHLRIILHHTLDQEVPDTFGFGRTLANTTCHVDLHAVAAGFIDSDTMPTLEYLFLVACGCGHAVRMYSTGGRCYHYQTPHQWLSSNAWRVVHDRDGDPRDPESSARSCALEELSVEEAEKVMDSEDFRISPHEENKLLGSIKHLRLTHMRIVFYYTVYLFLRNPVSNADPVNIRVMDGMDIHLTARRFVDAMPTLRCLFLTTCGHTHAIPSRKISSHLQQHELGKWLLSKVWELRVDRGRWSGTPFE